MAPDVNVLVAASRTDHPHHRVAFDWLETAPGVLRARLEDEWSLFLQLCRTHELTGNDIPDAWIAAAVVAQREQLATFDRGFKRWLAPEQLHVLTPAG